MNPEEKQRIAFDAIKRIRAKTGVGWADAAKAWDLCGGSDALAELILRHWGLAVWTSATTGDVIREYWWSTFDPKEAKA